MNQPFVIIQEVKLVSNDAEGNPYYCGGFQVLLPAQLVGR